MAKFSISEVIEQAVQTEKLGAEFYSKNCRNFFRCLQQRKWSMSRYLLT